MLSRIRMHCAVIAVLVGLACVSCEKKATESSTQTIDAAAQHETDQSASKDVLKVVYFPVPPKIMSGDDPTKPIGASVEFLTAVANEMGMGISFQELPVVRCIRELEEGRADMGAVFAHSERREKSLLFPGEPYGFDYPAVLVRKDSPLHVVKEAKDLDGLRIGYVKANIEFEFLKNADVETFILYGESPLPRLIRKLVDGDVDAVIWGELGALYTSSDIGVRDQVRSVRLPLPPRCSYVVFRSDERGQMLLKRYEKAFATVSAVTPFETFLEKY